MSFLEERTGAEKLGGVLAVIAIVIVLRVAFNAGGFDGILGNGPEAMAERMEEAMLEDPTFAPMYATMKEEFPEDFELFKSQLVTVAQQRGSDTVAFDTGSAFMQDFMARNADNFRAAPDAALVELRDDTIGVIELLAVQDEAICAHFATTGLRPADQPSQRAMARLGEASSAQLRAVAAGRDNPVERTDPTEADLMAYIDVLSNMGMTDAQIDDFLQGAFGLMRESDAVQCEVGTTIYRGLAQLPDEVSARISAVMLLPVE